MIFLVLLLCGPSLTESFFFHHDHGLRRDFNHLKGQVGHLGNRVAANERGIADLRRQLGAFGTRLTASERSIAVVRQKVGALEKVVAGLKCQEKVVFSASAKAKTIIGPFSADTTLIYNSVLTNIGGAYNHETGIFTAPVTGVYYFTAFVHSRGPNPAALYLMKNDERLAMVTDHRTDSGGSDNGGNAVFVQLQPGDKVFVRMLGKCHVWATDGLTSLSGFLLSGC